ncbi:MAG: iron ABC transporter permease [Actinobacteria bacterium]|nr:iron ABC transporter permease [Actinomycetota bacterium]
MLTAVAAVIAAAALGSLIGPVHIPVSGAARSLLNALPGIDVPATLTDRQVDILTVVRLPRVALGGLVGAILALAGAAYQGVFRNPLADPYLLGVAAGAGLGATLAIAAGSSATGAVVPIAAFAGAVGGVLMTYVLGRTVGRRTDTSLILAGVAVASFLTALQTYIQQRNSSTLREVYAWILGRLSTSGWHEVLLILPYVAIGGVVILLHRRMLDVLSLGDEEASALGVPVRRVRLLVVTAATLGTAAAVAVGGLIGFVGIIVPHAVRLVTGASYRVILPLSALLGAAFLIVADVVARTALSPAELPIGVVTAFLGAPFFVLVLRTSRGLR